jgi:L-aspartate oxidase
MTSHRDRVIVIGGGIGGLATALYLAPLPVTLLVKSRLDSEAATLWAQGGIAAAIGPDDDPALHAADTLRAGAGLGDPMVAARVAAAAPKSIEDLASHGVHFDRDAEGRRELGLEGAHSRRRIVHANGDATGRVVMNALIAAARAAPSIEIVEDTCASELVTDDGVVLGVHARRAESELAFAARAVVLATGGIGGLYADTTNPLGSVGSGIALAARAGAVLHDMEFVQFHPTAIALGRDPMPLATEALRGEGAVLVNGNGERFLAGTPGAELASRDVVARAIWREIAAGGTVFLDARAALGASLPQRFPAVTGLCRAAGLDPVTQPIPVRPAAHYHMGGAAVDARGRTSLQGLWACGEVAATGLHGANRLASNSLLEALVYARWIAADIAGHEAGRPVRLPPPTQRAAPPAHDRVAELRRLMASCVGVLRDAEKLTKAAAHLSVVALEPHSSIADRALVGACIALAALERCESRGAHFRSDYPHPSLAWARSSALTLADVERRAAALEAA